MKSVSIRTSKFFSLIKIDNLRLIRHTGNAQRIRLHELKGIIIHG